LNSIEDQILHILKDVDRPLSPKEITNKGRINHNSVRSTLSKLLKKGKVQKVYYGAYKISPIYGVGRSEPVRVQNLTFVCEGVVVDKSHSFFKWDYRFGSGVDEFRLALLLGFKRGKITWTVKAPLGLDLYGLRLCIKIIRDKLESLGYVIPDFNQRFIARNSEYLRDTFNLRIEGVKSITLDDLDGTLEKYYNKSYGIRHETRTNQPTSIDNIFALVSGGMPFSQLIQGVGVVNRGIENLVETLKFRNRKQDETDRKVDALFDAVNRLIERMNGG